MRKVAVFLVAVLALAIAGCGQSSGGASTERGEPTETESAVEAAEVRAAQRRAARKLRHEIKKHRREREQEPEPEPEPKPEAEEAAGPPAAWTSEEKQQYEIAKGICGSEPLSQLASEWNTSADPGSVAHAYGLEYRNRPDMVIATEEGCLAALIP